MPKPALSVAYEVTVRLASAADADEFTHWMETEHIPAVLATGCFGAADLSRLDAATFRTRYLAADEAHLDDYLSSHTAALRTHFAARFGARAEARREIWHLHAEWP